MSTKRVHIVLTSEQAGAVCAALDLYSRMGVGQVREIVNLTRAGSIPFATKPASFDDQMRRLDEIDAMTRQIAKSLGFDSNASLGIGNKRVPIAAHRAYEVQKVIDKALAEDRDPDPQFKGVHYDGLSVRYTDDPAPVARVERAEQAVTSSGHASVDVTTHLMSLRAAASLRRYAMEIRAGALVSENPDVWDSAQDEVDYAECVSLANWLESYPPRQYP